MIAMSIESPGSVSLRPSVGGRSERERHELRTVVAVGELLDDEIHLHADAQAIGLVLGGLALLTGFDSVMVDSVPRESGLPRGTIGRADPIARLNGHIGVHRGQRTLQARGRRDVVVGRIDRHALDIAERLGWEIPLTRTKGNA